MASHEGSRKRLKMSRAPTPRANGHMTAAASSSLDAPIGASNGAACSSDSCSHEQSLKTLHTDIEAMRHLVTCKVCDRLLYEPYALACGHTYCYQCLRQWFENNPRKKTCPDCRVVITQQPTPSYLLREMVLIFVSRNEMLPDGETTEEHHKWQKEEADLIAADKANTDQRTGGLFKGMFKRAHGAMRGYGAIHDPGDDVERCPFCHWEVEGGYCGQCDVVVDEEAFSDYDDDSDSSGDELDHELDAEDAAAVWGPDGEDVLYENEYPHDQFARDYSDTPVQPAVRAPDVVDISGSTDDDDPSEDEDDRDLTGFVVGDDEVAYAESDDGERSEATDVPRQRRPRRTIVISDDESDSGSDSTAARGPVPVSDDDEDGPVITGSQRNKRGSRMTVRQRHMSVSSSDDSSNDSNDAHSSDDDDDTHVHHDRNPAPVNLGGFSPLNEHDRDSIAPTSYHYEGTDAEDHGYYGGGGASSDGHQYVDDRWEVQSPSIDDDDDRYENHDGWGTRPETTRGARGAATAPPDRRSATFMRPVESFPEDSGSSHERPGPPSTAHRSHASASRQTANGASHSNHTVTGHRRPFIDEMPNRRVNRVNPSSVRPFIDEMPNRRVNRARPSSVDEDEDSDFDVREATQPLRTSAAHTSNRSPSSNRYLNHNALHAQSTGRSGRSDNHVAPQHPFQLGNTLASVNNSYNTRAHAPMMDRYLAPSQPSSSSDSSEITIVRGRDGRRKRALSIDSDAPVEGEGIWDHEQEGL